MSANIGHIWEQRPGVATYWKCSACGCVSAYRDFSDCHEVMRAALTWYDKHWEEKRRQVARQARTIRRLFTAYFLAKGLAKERDRLCSVLMKDGAAKERARIVAALRAKVCANTSTYWDREATALGIVADAIERGEL